jgi:hypothetical protein
MEVLQGLKIFFGPLFILQLTTTMLIMSQTSLQITKTFENLF